MLREAFLNRFQLTDDLHEREREFNTLTCVYSRNLNNYVDRLQHLAAKLGKDNQALLTKFMLGLPDKHHRYVRNQAPMNLSEAINHARDSFVMFEDSRSVRRINFATSRPEDESRSKYRYERTRSPSPWYRNSWASEDDTRAEEPMEHNYNGRRRPSNLKERRNGRNDFDRSPASTQRRSNSPASTDRRYKSPETRQHGSSTYTGGRISSNDRRYSKTRFRRGFVNNVNTDGEQESDRDSLGHESAESSDDEQDSRNLLEPVL